MAEQTGLEMQQAAHFAADGLCEFNGIISRHPLGADADAILDHIECFFRHDILGNQFAFHTIGTIGHDPIGHILGQTKHEDHIAG